MDEELQPLREYQMKLLRDTGGLSPRRMKAIAQEIMAEIYLTWQKKYDELESKYAGCVREYEKLS